MSETKNSIRLFEERHVRAEWDEENEKWWFSVIDIVAVLTEQPDIFHARTYWNVLKNRLKKEGSQTLTNCKRLKLTAGSRG